MRRYQDPVYKIISPPVNFAEGSHNVKFSYTEPVEREATFKRYDLTPVNARFTHVSPCVLDATHCSVEARRQARVKHHQNYNSVLQMGEGYFKTRNFDESFNKTIVEHPMHRFNIEKGSLRDPSRTKRGGGKSSEAR